MELFINFRSTCYSSRRNDCYVRPYMEKIYTTSKSLKKTLGEQSNATKRIVVATTNMSFFIIVFILRFSVPAVHAFWTYIDEPPKILLDIIACATSAGGIFNGMIYLTIRREHL